MKNFPDYLFILLMAFPAIIISSTTIMASSLDDPNGCTVSPDNQGCKLNRPIDFERQAKKHNSVPQKGYYSLKFYKY
ncbi:MAG: hypothetical protein QNJ65_06800 [Xenococcaceae cyanobacterium MO_234.B1]|nr:hypothetical protein [Xenococcaceae cyanobacterium MO_234.B1]